MADQWVDRFPIERQKKVAGTNHLICVEMLWFGAVIALLVLSLPWIDEGFFCLSPSSKRIRSPS
jgi:hypothetical protein